MTVGAVHLALVSSYSTHFPGVNGVLTPGMAGRNLIAANAA
jgi:hypothetical protein